MSGAFRKLSDMGCTGPRCSCMQTTLRRMQQLPLRSLPPRLVKSFGGQATTRAERLIAAASASLSPSTHDSSPPTNHVSVEKALPSFDLKEPVSTPQSEEEKKRLWMAAIKPPMYSVGIAPVLVANAAANAHYGILPSFLSTCGLVFGAIFVIAWLNLSNDAFDSATGVDKTKPESVVNLMGDSSIVLWLANGCLVVGLYLLASVILAAQDMRVVYMLGVAIACGYVYQGPPFRLSYKGLGEPLCFLAFGLMAVPAFFLALKPQLPAEAAATLGSIAASNPATLAGLPVVVWLLAVVVGITTTVILFCSHFHQIKGDTAAGKMSPLVRLGTERGIQVLSVATAAPYVMLCASAACGSLPPLVAAASFLSLKSRGELMKFAEKNHKVPAAIAPLKKYAIAWHVAVCLTLVLSLNFNRLFNIMLLLAPKLLGLAP